MATLDSIQPALQRHEERRRQGIATVSLLVGPPEQAESNWADWIQTTRRGSFHTTASEPLAEWWRQVLASDAVREALWVQMAEAFQTDALTLEARYTQQQEEDHGLFWEALAARTPSSGLAVLAQQIVEERPPELSADAILGLQETIGPAQLPAIFLSGAPSPATLLRLCSWALRVPALTVAVSVADGQYARFLAEASESRERAVALEGVIHLVAGEQQAPTLEALRAEASGSCAHAGESRAASDLAQKAAGRLLHAALEASAGTRGMFGLHQPAELLIANRPVEIALLARERRVAIELEGDLRFVGPAEYRRDRQKDVALQEHGYLVLRFLAEDIPARLDEVLATVEAAIARRSTAR